MFIFVSKDIISRTSLSSFRKIIDFLKFFLSKNLDRYDSCLFHRYICIYRRKLHIFYMQINISCKCYILVPFWQTFKITGFVVIIVDVISVLNLLNHFYESIIDSFSTFFLLCFLFNLINLSTIYIISSILIIYILCICINLRRDSVTIKNSLLRITNLIRRSDFH